MNNTFKNSFIFIVGAAVGSIVTWKLLEAKCEARIQEEVASVKEAYRNRYSNNKVEQSENCDSVDDSSEVDQTLDFREYASMLKEEEYTDYSDATTNAPIDAPYIISPNEFAEFDDYEHITLFYYTDGIVATREDEIIDDVDDVVGVDSLTRFGEYEDDAVHVRNDAKKCDYEILRSQMSYPEMIKSKPHLQMEVK